MGGEEKIKYLQDLVTEYMDICEKLSSQLNSRRDQMLGSIEHACKTLPDGFMITIGMEKDAAWVSFEHKGKEHTIDMADMSLIEQVEYCVTLAKWLKGLDIESFSGL